MLEAIIGGIPKGTPFTNSYIASTRIQTLEALKSEAKKRNNKS